MESEPVDMSVADVRRELADVINAATTRHRTTYITNRGRRIAAIVPLDIAEQAEENTRK
jgi:prevent-host-death family protein